MAITRTPTTHNEEDSLALVFNNGDLAALRDAVERLGFKDEESFLRYLLAVASKSATRTLTVIDTDGKSQQLNPAEALLAHAAQAD